VRGVRFSLPKLLPLNVFNRGGKGTLVARFFPTERRRKKKRVYSRTETHSVNATMVALLALSGGLRLSH